MLLYAESMAKKSLPPGSTGTNTNTSSGQDTGADTTVSTVEAMFKLIKCKLSQYIYVLLSTYVLTFVAMNSGCFCLFIPDIGISGAAYSFVSIFPSCVVCCSVSLSYELILN